MSAARDINRLGTLSYNTISYDTVSYDVIRRNSQRNAAKRRAAARRRARRFKTNMALVLVALIAIFIVLGTVFFTAYAKTDETPVDKCYIQIMVEEGDSLWSIACEYMTADYDDVNDYIKELKQLNHISGDTIMAGYTLTIIAQN